MAPTSRSWIVLGQDGRHVTLGRAAAPTDEEIAVASDALSAQGLGGWIATLDGSYWSRGRVMLAPVQTIGVAADLDWPAAVAAFLDARRHTMLGLRRSSLRRSKVDDAASEAGECRIRCLTTKCVSVSCA